MSTDNVAPPALHVCKDADGVVHLAGELDMATTPQLQVVLRRLIADGNQTVVLDLAELNFCDSTGLGVFVNAHRDLPAGLIIRHPSSLLQKLLHTTGLDAEFPVI